MTKNWWVFFENRIAELEDAYERAKNLGSEKAYLDLINSSIEVNKRLQLIMVGAATISKYRQ